MNRKSAPPALPVKGDVVMDRYRVERLVGVGGMAHVLAAKHLTLGHDVAIKILDPMLIEDADAKERFAREARAMASLSSKHIVRVFDVGALPSGLPFMVMELLVGHDLHHELQEHGPLPLSEACEYIDQACQAVAEAHAAGIIHRDLKPQNLFLTKVKGSAVIRVLDFGIARIIGGGVTKLETITRLGDVVGTLQYMAPEQVRSSKSVEPRSDVWALGACLYKLITGYPPFPQQGEAPLMSAILTSPPTPIAEYRQDVPAVLSSVIMRCLRKPPEERFPTANDLRKAIGEASMLMLTETFGDVTDIMSKRADPGGVRATLQAAQPLVAPAQAASGPAGFSKTMPLDASFARQILEQGSPQPQRHSTPNTLARPPTPSQPMVPTPQQRPSFPTPPTPQALLMTAPSQNRRSSPSSSLSFVMIVLAVAIGVFIAGVGLMLVIARHR